MSEILQQIVIFICSVKNGYGLKTSISLIFVVNAIHRLILKQNYFLVILYKNLFALYTP